MKTNTSKNASTRKSNEAAKTPKVSCEMALNTEFNGVELKFSAKPSEGIRRALKSAGFRWHSSKELWYAKQSESTLAFARTLAETPVDLSTVGGEKPAKKPSKKASSKKSTKPSKKASSKAKAKAPKEPSKAKAEPKAPKVEQLPIAFTCKSKPSASNKRLIKAINETEGLETYTDRAWLWVRGEGTRSHSEALKSLGFRFSGTRKEWYLA